MLGMSKSHVKTLMGKLGVDFCKLDSELPVVAIQVLTMAASI